MNTSPFTLLPSALRKICVVAAVAIMVAACDRNLNIEPVTQIDSKTSLNNSQGVEVALTGAYFTPVTTTPGFGGVGDLFLYGGQVQLYGDLLGDDRELVFGGTFLYLDEIWKRAIIPNNQGVQEVWMGGFRTINRVNAVLSAISVVDESERARVEGEASFIRGMVYFDMARFYGKQWGDGDNATNPAVPLVTKPTDAVSEADQFPRSSVAEIYAQAISDLTKAEMLLPVTNRLGNGYRANKTAAQAMLARLYLQQGNYAAARDAANRAITTGTNKMATNFANIFTDGAAGFADESVFRIYVDEKNGANNLQRFYAAARFQGRGEIRVQAKHTALYAANDLRGQFFYLVGSNRYTSKYTDQFGDVPLIRITEMFLIRAECNARLNTSVGASPKDDINAIRKRAGADALDNVTVNDVLRERRFELSFEGFRIHDIKRTRGTIGVDNLPFNANSALFPVPLREMDANKKLVQNPGY